MTTRQLSRKYSILTWQSRYFVSMNRACKFQRHLTGEAWRTSALVWVSVDFDLQCSDFKAACQRYKVRGMYRVSWRTQPK